MTELEVKQALATLPPEVHVWLRGAIIRAAESGVVMVLVAIVFAWAIDERRPIVAIVAFCGIGAMLACVAWIQWVVR